MIYTQNTSFHQRWFHQNNHYHSAATFITKQTNFITVNIMKLNLCLIRVSKYISQFNFDIRYRFGKIHLIFDALNRLFESIESFHTFTLKNLNDITDFYANTATLVKMDPNFKNVSWQDIRRNHNENEY